MADPGTARPSGIASSPRRVVNLGYGWDRTENVLWRLTHGEFEGVEPRVVVVMIGTNNVGINTPAEIAAGIDAICATIHARSPSTRILLLGIFPRGERPNAARDTVLEINRQSPLSTVAMAHLSRIGSRFVAADGSIGKDVMSDFLHPTARGTDLVIGNGADTRATAGAAVCSSPRLTFATCAPVRRIAVGVARDRARASTKVDAYIRHQTSGESRAVAHRCSSWPRT